MSAVAGTCKAAQPDSLHALHLPQPTFHLRSCRTRSLPWLHVDQANPTEMYKHHCLVAERGITTKIVLRQRQVFVSKVRPQSPSFPCP